MAREAASGRARVEAGGGGEDEDEGQGGEERGVGDHVERRREEEREEEERGERGEERRGETRSFRMGILRERAFVCRMPDLERPNKAKEGRKRDLASKYSKCGGVS